MKRLCLFSSVALLLALAACTSPNRRVATTLNNNAALTGHLTWNPLQWEVITSTVDAHDSTMSTLFGNVSAVQYARTHSDRDYPDGAIISLVTWKEREDPRWFGGRIPDKPASVEFVSVSVESAHRHSYSYAYYEGAPLKQAIPPEGQPSADRIAYLLSQRAAVMP